MDHKILKGLNCLNYEPEGTIFFDNNLFILKRNVSKNYFY